jgi:triosephosphate isomerase
MAANWKMYKTASEAGAFAAQLCASLPELPPGREILVCPPFTAITAVSTVFSGKSGFFTGAQNLYPAEEGAFTGEISPSMLHEAGASWVLAGHSERRSIFGESDELIGRKTVFALACGLNVLLCIGETLEQREAGELAPVLERQLAAALADVPPSCPPSRLAVAYEPVWAIGTGKVAGSAEIREAHALTRRLLNGRGHGISRILYGGSVKPENAAEIIGLDNVDGVLVGGASLQTENFLRIIRA